MNDEIDYHAEYEALQERHLLREKLIRTLLDPKHGSQMICARKVLDIAIEYLELETALSHQELGA